MEININKKDFIKSYKLEGNKPSSSSYINQKVYEPIRKSVTRGLSGEGSNLFSATKKDFDSSINRDEVLLRKNLSEENLNRERAENQSALEQLGNFVAQAAGSEVVVGTALGLSNLVDFVANIGRDQGKDDYTNSVSEYLEGIQNDIKDRFKIYREDPNATWAIGDFGWWADNMVTIASTASMLLPTLTVTKGLGALSKLGKLDKVSKGVAKMIHRGPRNTRAASKLARQINMGTELGLNATLSRTMEGYLESREVYNTVYDNTLQRIKEMSTEEKVDLISNNSDLLTTDMTDEEIASHIASVSADETFRNDYAMLLFDLAQFKALPNIWKGRNTVATAKQRLINKNAIANIGNSSAKVADDIGFLAKQKEAFSYALKNPINSLTALELTEGIEEGYQGIQTEKGKEVAEKILDPTFIGRSLDSYLTDPQIWEQAFWGVLGGIGFQTVGRGLGKLEKVLEKSIDKSKLSEQDFKLKYSAEELTKRIEIDSRNSRFQQMYETIDSLNKRENPFKDLVDDFGVPYPEKLSQEQADELKDRYIHQEMTEMVLDAADAGNWDLFKEYVTSKEFNEHYNNTLNQNDQAFLKQLIDEMDDTFEAYNEAMYLTFDNIKVKNPNIGRLMARQIVRNENTLKGLNNKLNNLYTEFNNYEDSISANFYKDKEKLKAIQYELKNIDTTRDELKASKSNNPYIKSLSKQAKDAYINELNEREKVLVQELQKINGYELEYDFKDDSRNEFLGKLFEFINRYNASTPYNEPTNNLKKLAKEINKTELAISKVESNILTNQKDYQKLYDELSITNDRVVRKRYEDAVDNVSNWIKKQEDYDKALTDVLENNIPDEIKDDVKILKLGHHNTKKFYDRLKATIGVMKKDKQEEEAKADNVQTGSNPVNGEQATIIKEKAKAVSEETTNQVRQTVEEQESKINNKPYTKDTNGEWFEVGDEIEGTNYDVNGNISKNPNSVWKGKIVKVYDNGSIEIEGGVQFTPTMIREFFGLPVPKIKGATSRFTYNSRLGKPRPQTPPSTGGGTETTSAKTAVKNIISKPEPIANITEEEYNEAKGQLDTIPQVSEEDKEILDKAAYLQQRIFDANRSLDKSIKDAVIGKDNKSEEFRILCENLKSVLAQNGILNFDEDVFNEVANQILDAINFINGNTTDKFMFAVTSMILQESTTSDMLNDILDAYIEERINNNDKINTNEKSLINVVELFKYLIKNNKITPFQAKLLAQSLATVDTDKYILEDIDKIYDEKNKSDLISKIAAEIALENENVLAESMHASSPSKPVDNFKEVILGLKAGDKLIARGNKKSISIRALDKNGEEVEIAYLATVKKNENGNEFSIASDNIKGFYFVVSENNGEYFAKGIDDFFINLIDGSTEEYKQLYDLIYRDYISKIDDTTPKLTDNEKNIIYNLGFKLIKDYFAFSPKYTEKSVNDFIEEVTNILFYETKLHSKSIKKASYHKFIKTKYTNYKDTYEIQQSLDGKSDVRIEFMSMTDSKLLIDSNWRNINDAGIDPDKHPIICRLNGERRLSVEGSDTQYENRPGFSVGTMGYLLQTSNGAPMIAVVRGNSLISNKNFANRVAGEIKDILTKYQNQEYSFEEVHKRLVDLLGSSQNKAHNLFRGINVILHNNRILLNIDGSDKFNLIIHKFKKGTNDIGTGISYNPDGKRENVQPFNTPNDTILSSIANDIVNKLSFNTTFYPIHKNGVVNTANEQGVEENYYLSKQDGKFVVTIGGTEERFNSFGHFAMAKNAFSTNQYTNEQGGFFGLEKPKPKSIYIKVVNNISPVEGKQSVLDVITSDKDSKGVSTKDALLAANEDENFINFLLGNNPANIELIPKKIYFGKSNTQASAYFDPQKKRIYLTENGAKYSNDSNKPDAANGNLVRLLLHENLHRRLFFSKDVKIDDIVDGLIETYNLFIDAINKDNTVVGKRFRDWVKENNFTPENYFKQLSPKEQKDWAKRSEKERLTRFAEEWLAETLSQKGLIEYLNTVTIEEEIIVDNLDDNNKTLFQKIIDLLLKLFGISNKNIKNNTILAKEYMLFKNVTEGVINNNTEYKKAEQVADNKPGESSTETNNDVAEEISEDSIIPNEDDYNYDDIYSTTSQIEISTINYTNEEQTILNNAPRNSQDQLLAPNGKVSNLTERQYAQVRTKAFKKWFGDWENDIENASKVIDENGEPLVVWHSSKDYFNIFDKSKGGSNTGARDSKNAFYFMKDREGSKWYSSDLLHNDFRHTPLNIKSYINDIFKNTELLLNIIENEGDYYNTYRIYSNGLIVDLYGGVENIYTSEYFNQLPHTMQDDILKQLQIPNNINKLTKDLQNALKYKNDINSNYNIDSGVIIDGNKKLRDKIEKHFVRPFFLNIKTLEEIKQNTERKTSIIENISNTNKDGIKIIDTYDSATQSEKTDVYAVFEPNQIKSATDNIGTFSKENDDIRYSTTSTISIDEVLIETRKNNTIYTANSAINVKNMGSYIQQFPVQDQPLISKMVANNEIKFVC